MLRKRMKSFKDKKVFRATAVRGKAINLRPMNFRGGIRL